MPRKPYKLEEYDLIQLRNAKELVNKIYSYNYSAPNSGPTIRKLETIMNKINDLIKESEATKK